MHRNLGVFTGRGLDLPRLFRQLLGKDGGFTKGRDRTFHFGALDKRIVGMISHLGAMLPVADGLALARSSRGERRVAAAFTGDGATSEGDFHEAREPGRGLEAAGALRDREQPVRPLDARVASSTPAGDLADRGLGYGMPGRGRGRQRPAGRASRGARARPSARGAATGRRCSSSRPSACAATRRPRAPTTSRSELFEEWAQKDPVRALREPPASSRASLAEAERDAMRARAASRASTRSWTRRSPAPEPGSSGRARSSRDVYAPSLRRPRSRLRREALAAAPELRYVDAISDGLREAMRRDERVLLLGQDIAEYGGVFKVTEGFVAEFGKARVRNTPIIESGALGARWAWRSTASVPMVEMQFGDFITCGFNQIVNNLAKTHYRWGAARAGGRPRAGRRRHRARGRSTRRTSRPGSRSVAGLKVVAPATPYDAKGLLLAAFEDGNPVLYLEHKLLYRSAKGRVPAGTTRSRSARRASRARAATRPS